MVTIIAKFVAKKSRTLFILISYQNKRHLADLSRFLQAKQLWNKGKPCAGIVKGLNHDNGVFFLPMA
jgi:hypothetical protein